MKYLRRLLYLAYYFRELDWVTFRLFKNYVKTRKGWSSGSIWWRVLVNSLKYNISLMEYFQFRFYEIPEPEKATYAGTGFMYEFQLKMNPKNARQVLADKHKFLKAYSPYVGHVHVSREELEQQPQRADTLLANASGKVVLKNSLGQCGLGIEVIDAAEVDASQLVDRLNRGGNDLAEEFVVQHKALMHLSPAGLNTVRMITQLNADDQVEILGARLRITVNSVVDNLAAGNLAAPVNLQTGVVDGPAVYSDITKADQVNHPVTGVAIPGFQVPFWRESLELVKAAAAHNKSNRSIGWDVAITPTGPSLIEGNHDWCKLLWQLPAKRGLKPELEKYLA